MDMLYLDNAATSWPKPDCVAKAMMRFMNEVGANPGRSGHRLSVEAGRIVNDARENVAKIFNEQDPLKVLFGLNATDALNLGIRGTIVEPKGAHVITSSMEHNSVARPLRDLEKLGLEITIVPCSKEGFLDPADVNEAIKKNTKLIVMNHGSNVSGSLLPLRGVGKVVRDHGLPFLVDTAQTAGVIPIDMQADFVDMVAFTGHKGLLGPQGTGGLVVGDQLTEKDLAHIRSGGTGSKSEFEVQPPFFPDKYESGTMNTVGLAGLAAGTGWILNETVEKIHDHEMALTRRMLRGLAGIQGITVCGGKDEKRQTSTISINIEGLQQSDVGLILDEDYDIMVRVGLHCAPLAHKTLGTFPAGTVRLAMGYFVKESDVDYALDALKGIAERGAKAKKEKGAGKTAGKKGL